jgi:nuclear cap-binding protein subunit 2
MNTEENGTSESNIIKPRASLMPPLPRIAEMMFAHTTEEKKLYWDRSHYDCPASQMKALTKSSTLYIGNLAFSTRSHHIRAHFRQVGPVKSVHMGLDRFLKAPCGFCFVEYARREDALEAVASLTGTKLDNHIIRVELDAGFQPGRQYGRGASGGQVRDDRRSRQDPARGRTSNNSNNDNQGSTNDTNNSNNKGPDTSYYGSGDKRERGEDDADMGDRPEKNPRFRED